MHSLFLASLLIFTLQSTMSQNVDALPKHHVKQKYCETRPKYRRGRRKTAVKVFTVNVESKYLIISGIPVTGLAKDLAKLFSNYGVIQQCRELTDYPREEFTQVFLLQYQHIQAAKTAKRKLDEHYFYGGTLHVFYGPEYETISDTREKINYRRQSVTARVKFLGKEKNQQIKKKSEKILNKRKFSNLPTTIAQQEYKGKNIFHPSDKVPSNPFVNASLPHKLTTYNIPCNAAGIPLHLPPPPPPCMSFVSLIPKNKLPPNPRLTSSEKIATLSSTSNSKVSAGSISDQSDKKPKLRPKTGYFYQKVLHELGTKPISSSALPKSTSAIFFEKEQGIAKCTKQFEKPLFLPRLVELQQINEINKLDTGPNGELPLLGSFIFNNKVSSHLTDVGPT